MKKVFSIHFLLLLIFGTIAAQSNRQNVTPKTDGPYQPGQQNERSVLPHLIHADNLMKSFAIEQAIFEYDAALAIDPYAAEIYFKRGVAKHKIGRVQEAEEDFRMAEMLNPYVADLFGYPDTRRRLSLLDFEPSTYLKGLSKSIENSYFCTYLQHLHYHFLELGDEVDEYELDAFLFIDSLSLLNPCDLSTLSTDNMVSAIDEIDYFIDTDKEAFWAMDLKGFLLMKIGALESAERSFQNALRINPTYHLSIFHLGILQKRQGNYTKALSHVEKAIELIPDKGAFYLERAYLLFLTGSYKQALKEYTWLMENYAEYRAVVQFNRGLIYKILGNAEAAIEDFEAVFMNSEAPSAVVYKLRGNVYFLVGQIKQAIQFYDRALEIDPSLHAAHLNRGLARFLLNQRIDACRDFSIASDQGNELGSSYIQYFCNF